jgi:hypothetical protein
MLGFNRVCWGFRVKYAYTDHAFLRILSRNVCKCMHILLAEKHVKKRVSAQNTLHYRTEL